LGLEQLRIDGFCIGQIHGGGQEKKPRMLRCGATFCTNNLASELPSEVNVKVKVKLKVPVFAIALFTQSDSWPEALFTISGQVAADRHKLMINLNDEEHSKWLRRSQTYLQIVQI